MLQPFPEKSREQRIRDEFSAVGGAMATREFALHCIEVGIWPTEELIDFQVGKAQDKVRAALKHMDRNGLPFAGQTTRCDDEGAHLWTIRQLWMFDDYELNVRELVTQRDSLQAQAEKLVDECQERFGFAPSLGLIVARSAAD